MSQLFKNNAKSRITGDFPAPGGSGPWTFTVTTGDGALFPSVATGTPDYYLVTLEDSNGNKEVVKVDDRTGDTFQVIEREVEPTESETGFAFSTGDIVELRLTSGFIDAIKRGSIVFVIDGVGAEITTGVKGFIEIPFGGSIEAARAFADVSGDLTVNIYKQTYDDYPFVDPDDLSDEITDSTGANDIRINGAYKFEDTTLTGWVRTFNPGDIFVFVVTDSGTTGLDPSNITKCTISLTVDRNAQ